MATYRDAAVMARAKKARFAKKRRSLEAETEEIALGLKAEAIRLNSGTTTQRQLDEKGNPFGRGRGRKTTVEKFKGRRRRGRRAKGFAPLLPINEQTGRLKRSLRLVRVRRGDTTSYRLFFTVRHAKWILAPGGTSRMVSRRFWEAMRRKRTHLTRSKRPT